MPQRQQAIDFETPRREAYAQLEGAFLVLAGAERAADRACAGVRLLAKDLLGLTFNGNPVEWTIAELAEKYGKSPSRIREIVAKAVRLGLVTRTERRACRGGQQSNQLAIDLEGIRRLATQPRDSRSPAPAAAGKGENAKHTPRAAGNEISLPGQRDSGGRPTKFRCPIKGIETLRETNTPLPPAAAQQDATPRTSPTSGGWEGIFQDLKAAGMARPADALAPAKAAGVAPVDAAAVIAHWQACPGAWDLGGLWSRLRRLRPGDDPAADWPEPAEAWQRVERQRRREAEERARERMRATMAAERAAAAAERIQRETLEAELGDELDRLPDGELRELLAGEPLAARQPIERLRGGLWRSDALAALAARKEKAPA